MSREVSKAALAENHEIFRKADERFAIPALFEKAAHFLGRLLGNNRLDLFRRILSDGRADVLFRHGQPVSIGADQANVAFLSEAVSETRRPLRI